MKFWTVQKKEVIEMVKENGIYQSDFSKSEYIQTRPELKDLYNRVLKSFNQINNMELLGVVFAFCNCDGKNIYQIEEFKEFYTFIQHKKAVIDGMWYELRKKDVVIVELDYEESFNPIFVDINDFQFLMPPVISVIPYTEQDVKRVCQSIHSGKFTKAALPSNVIQAHLPYIKSENIVNIYPMFDFE